LLERRPRNVEPGLACRARRIYQSGLFHLTCGRKIALWGVCDGAKNVRGRRRVKKHE
jgi:hypothetical protein